MTGSSRAVTRVMPLYSDVTPIFLLLGLSFWQHGIYRSDRGKHDDTILRAGWTRFRFNDVHYRDFRKNGSLSTSEARSCVASKESTSSILYATRPPIFRNAGG